MPQSDFYVNVHLHKIAQLVEARIGNATTSERDALAATLNGAHKGLIVYDTDLLNLYVWDGTQFSAPAAAVEGAMVYKGLVTSSTTAPVDYEVGYVYVWSGAQATLTWAGQTFSPDAVVQNGDQIIHRGSNTWDIFQSDLNPSSETEAGFIAIATQAEANAGTNDTKAVTSLKLQGKLNAGFYVKQYFTTVNLTANSALTINHNLNLVDRDAFTINTMFGNSGIHVDVDSVNANSLTIFSLISLSNVKVTVQGAVSA